MYRRILVPLDGSPLSEQSIPYALILAKGLKSEINLFRAFSSVPSEVGDPTNVEEMVYIFGPLPAGYRYPSSRPSSKKEFKSSIIASMRNSLKDYLEERGQPLKAEGVNVSSQIYEGEAATAIIEEGQRQPNTLIVMSTHGRSGLTRWLLGSVATKVICGATNPLLLIHPQDESKAPSTPKLDSIVVPVDGSTIAEQILPHVAAVAKALQLSVKLVSVVPPFAYFYTYTGTDYAPFPYMDVAKEEELLAMSYLEKTEAKLKKESVKSVEKLIVHGDPAASIVDAARDTPNSMVAMTTHGRSGVGRWFLGSVADRVVRYSGAPVLLVRARKEE